MWRTRQAAGWLVISTLLGTGSCAHDKDRSGYPFECGELDFYDVVALIHEFRAYEVACGTMPESERYLHDLSWREVAAEYRERGPGGLCDGDSERSALWSSRDHACAIEATVNLQIHGYQVMGCPTWKFDSDLRPSDNYYVPFSELSYDLELVLDLICLPTDG
jgi:hypothetical protein